MYSLVKTVKYGAVNETDTKTIGYYDIKYISDTFILQEYITIDVQVRKYVELVFRATYISEIQLKKMYWKQ